MIYVTDRYLVHYNHNHDPRDGKFTSGIGGAVRGAASSVGSALLKKKKKPIPPDADIKYKQGGSKSDNTKLGKDEKARLMNSGSLEEINANKDRLSNKELEFAINRIQKEKNDRVSLEKRLSELNGPEAQTKIEQGAAFVEKAVKDGVTMKDLKEKGMSAWNVMAKIHNATSGDNDKWITFDKDGNPQSNGPKPDAVDLITKGSMSEILKNKDVLTTDQITQALKRREEVQKLEKAAADEAAKTAAAKQAQAEQKQAESVARSEKKEAKAREKAERKAQKKAAKEAKKTAQVQAQNNPAANIDWSRKNSESNDVNWDRPSSYDWNKQLDRNEKKALRNARRQNNQSTRDGSNINVQTYDNSYNDDRTVSRTSLSTSYQPSDAVKDFVRIYYDQKVPEGSKTDKVIDAAVLGYEIYRQRKKRRY